MITTPKFPKNLTEFDWTIKSLKTSLKTHTKKAKVSTFFTLSPPEICNFIAIFSQKLEQKQENIFFIFLKKNEKNINQENIFFIFFQKNEKKNYCLCSNF